MSQFIVVCLLFPFFWGKFQPESDPYNLDVGDYNYFSHWVFFFFSLKDLLERPSYRDREAQRDWFSIYQFTFSEWLQ